MKFDKILVPTDFSEGSAHALHYAIGFCKTYGSSLKLLHVIEDLPVPSLTGYEGLDVGVYQERLREDCSLQFERVIRGTPDLGDIAIERCTRHGVPYMQIIEEARESGCDLIVLATHGRSGLSHFLLGSVAEKIVRNAPCPVLTMKMPDFDFENA
jgi:nucleotide-binding universal stress UspA family protein